MDVRSIAEQLQTHAAARQAAADADDADALRVALSRIDDTSAALRAPARRGGGGRGAALCVCRELQIVGACSLRRCSERGAAAQQRGGGDLEGLAVAEEAVSLAE